MPFAECLPVLPQPWPLAATVLLPASRSRTVLDCPVRRIAQDLSFRVCSLRWASCPPGSPTCLRWQDCLFLQGSVTFWRMCLLHFRIPSSVRGRVGCSHAPSKGPAMQCLWLVSSPLTVEEPWSGNPELVVSLCHWSIPDPLERTHSMFQDATQGSPRFSLGRSQSRS